MASKTLLASLAPLLLGAAPLAAQLSASELLLSDLVQLSSMGPAGDSAPFGQEPALAYSATEDEFLAVWEGVEAAGAPFEIYARRVEADTGFPIGSDVRVSQLQLAGQSRRPAVAYCPTNDRYLVVWSGFEELVPGGFPDEEIWGQFVSGSTGALVGSNFRISSMGATDGIDVGNAEAPDVVYNADTQEFLVVWTGYDDGHGLIALDQEVFGQRLDIWGQEIGLDDFRIGFNGADPVQGGYAQDACLAWNSEWQTYLVSWFSSGGIGLPFGVYAQLLEADTDPIGGNITVTDAFDSCVQPDVVANPDRGEFLVTWIGDLADVRQVYARRVDATSGSLLGTGETQVSQVTYTGNQDGAEFPRTTYCAARGLYLVSFHTDEDPSFGFTENVYGQWLDGLSAEERGEDDFPITQVGPIGNSAYRALDAVPAVRGETGEVLIVCSAGTQVAPLVEGEIEMHSLRLLAPTHSQEIVRLGTPPNPNALRPGLTSGPVAGLNWDPYVDHSSFLPQAQIDILGLHVQAAEMPSPLGTFLAVLAPNSIYMTAPAGMRFFSPIPANLNLVGLQMVAQVASIDATQVELTNALDIVIGTY